MREGGQRDSGIHSPVVAAISWLRAHPRLSLALALLALVAILIVDLLVPGYVIAAAYLVLVIFAAIALPRPVALTIAVAGLVLTIAVMVTQDAMTAGNLLLVGLGVLAGAAAFALVALSDSVESLYLKQQARLRRESFLVTLADALLPLDCPPAVQECAVRLIGDELAASKTAFCELGEDGPVERCAHDRRPQVGPSLDLRPFAAALDGAARPLVLPLADAPEQWAALREASLETCLAAPLRLDGKLIAAVAVCDAAPREWTGDEIELLQESAVRVNSEVRRARSDATLRDAESRLRDTLDSSVDGLFRFDVRTERFDYISPSAAAISGLSMDELTQLDVARIVAGMHPDDREPAVNAGLALERDGVATLDFRWTVNGHYRWISAVMRLTRDEGGEALFRTGTFRDVTERKRHEENLAFVASLQDELAKVTSPEDVMGITGARLGAQFGVALVFLAEIGDDLDATISTVWNSREAQPPPSKGRIPDYVSEEVLEALSRGRTVACADTEADPRTNGEAYRAAGMRSWIMAPFRRDGRLAFTFCVADPHARDWRDDELEVLRDVAVRVLPRLERARAEEALRVSEERFRLIVTTANEGIALCDAEDTVTFVNETLASWLGHTPGEMIGRAAKEFLSPADLCVQPARMDERRQGMGAQYDARLRTGDGDLRWFLVSATPVMGDGGELTGDLAMFTDISERKESEAALALHAHLLANVHDAICALDESFRVIYWNEAAEQLFGWTREEAVGSLSKELLRAAIPGSSWDDALAVLLRDGSYRGEVRYLHKDGHEFWADAHSHVIRNEAGEVEGVVASFRDISDQKRVREALAWEAARLRAIVDAAPVGLGIVGADGEVLLRNDVLRKIWLGEATVESVDEYESYKAYWPESGERLRPEEWPAAQALATGGSFADVVVDIERFDGSRGTIVLSTAPILDNDLVLGAVTIAQEITGLRDAEQALRFLTEEIRSLHEAVVLDHALSNVELASLVVAQAGLLLGSDGSSIFLLGEDGSLRSVAGVGEPDPPGLDDLVAEAIGERAAAVRQVPPPAGGPATAASVLLAVPLLLRDTVFGAMGFAYENRRSLGEHELRIARGFADQAALAIENARLRARIEESAIEAERTRLARDLHDSVTQSLFAASLKAEVLADLVGSDKETALDAVEDLRRLTRGALAGMRTMLLEMRADGLTQTPLPELVRHLVEASGSRIGADVRLAVEGNTALPAEVQTAFYRITQEALNNVARHAKAHSVWVDLSLGDTARLVVGDDGVGFGKTPAEAGHFGLRNMRERSEAVGAHFKVVSGVGRGTVVTVEWPFGEEEANDG